MAAANAGGIHAGNVNRVVNRFRSGNAARAAKRLRTSVLRRLGFGDHLISHRTALNANVRRLAEDAIRSVVAEDIGGELREYMHEGQAGSMTFGDGSRADLIGALMVARQEMGREFERTGGRLVATIDGTTYAGDSVQFSIPVASAGFLRNVGKLIGTLLGEAPESVGLESLPGSDIEALNDLNPATVRVIFTRATEADPVGSEESGGGFFAYWLSEEFPQDLSFLQVYKKSQKKNMTLKRRSSREGEAEEAACALEEEIEEMDLSEAGEDGESSTDSYELDCFGNTLVLLGIEDAKLSKYFDTLSGVRAPWLPTNRLTKISEELETNFLINYYSDKGTSKSSSYRRIVSVQGAPLLPIARVGNHYVPDISSGWTKWALLHLREILTRVEEQNRPLDKIRRAKAITSSGHLRTYSDEEMLQSGRLEATFGELLSILLYGVVPERTAGGSKRRRLLEKEPCYDRTVSGDFLTPLDPCEELLRTEMYMFFVDLVKDRTLPTDADPERMAEIIETYSKKDPTPHRQTFLNAPPIYLTDGWGRSTPVGKGVIPGIDNQSYGLFEDLYEKNGLVDAEPWHFSDHMVKHAVIRTRQRDRDGKAKLVRCDVRMHYTMIAYDFETTTDGDVHEPYLCSLAYYFDRSTGKPFSFRELKRIHLDSPEDFATVCIQKQTFYGRDCAQRMIDFVVDYFRDVMVLMVAHNLRYDLNQLIRTSKATISGGIFKSASGTNCADVLFRHSVMREDGRENRKETYHLDSLPIVSMSLERLGKTYKLSVFKEVMPYRFYSKKEWFRDADSYYPYSGQGDGPVVPLVRAASFLDGGKTIEEMREACARAEKMVGGTYPAIYDYENDVFDPVSYAAYYCETDCEVLLKGFTANRKEMAAIHVFPEDGIESPCCLDAFNCVSISQFASHVLGLSRCFDGTVKLSGSIRDYIASSVVGGRVMCEANLPHSCELPVEDFDACSLYPTSMAFIAEKWGGFPVGLPKYWNPTIPDLPAIESTNYYVITVRVTALKVPLRFPILSYKDESGGRHFTNDVVGKVFTVDKLTWEDACHFQGIEGEILCGLYFDREGNKHIGKLIRYLYDERKRKKKEGKEAAQQVMKLIMNSSYGRTIMRPIEAQTVFLQGAKEIQNYIRRHAVSIREVNHVREDFAIVERYQSIYKHFAQPQIGSFILSGSKRVMNEVMCLAEEQQCRIHYQDTDSMHIERESIPRLGKAFYEKYGRPLIAAPKTPAEACEVYEHPSEELGLFHGDFEGVPGWSQPVSVRSAYVGKKMYMDELEMRKEAEVLRKEHVRMKGVPTVAVTETAKEMNLSIYDLYQKLLSGERVEIDLFKCGRPFFEFTKNMVTRSKKEFKREVGLSKKQKARAEKEWEMFFGVE